VRALNPKTVQFSWGKTLRTAIWAIIFFNFGHRGAGKIIGNSQHFGPKPPYWFPDFFPRMPVDGKRDSLFPVWKIGS
jgi:hypothetical protein